MRMRNDFTDEAAMGPIKVVAPNKTATSYNEPGLPPPPAGWGKVLGVGEAQAEKDEDERSPDTDEYAS